MRIFKDLSVSLLLCSTAVGCGDGGEDHDDGRADGDALPSPQFDVRDVEATGLELDLEARTGVATIRIAASSILGAAFEVGDLRIDSVSSGTRELLFEALDGRLGVGVPEGTTELVVRYGFSSHAMFDGWNSDSGLTFLWPTFCRNLFPCTSNPADGSTFTIAVANAGAGTLVFPSAITAPAPAYMPAIARGEYTKVDLGQTTAGTLVAAYHLPGQEADTTAGTSQLRQVFDFFERTYGPYPYGKEVASVSAAWGPGAYGGMEHHPYWHVAEGAWGSAEVHAHEAAHGWFGNGVRIACWEDFVLSEGLATYLAARALGEFGVDLWPEYDCALASICGEGGGGTEALPATCGEINILEHPLWSGVPYQKGARYLREVAGIIGAAALDEVIAAFFRQNVGKAAEMEGLINAIKARGGESAREALDGAEQGWLRTKECPLERPVCVAPARAAAARGAGAAGAELGVPLLGR